MRSVNLLRGQIRQVFAHCLAQACWESGIPESLDEEERNIDGFLFERKFVLVVYFAGSVPVHYLFGVLEERCALFGGVNIRGPRRPCRANSQA